MEGNLRFKIDWASLTVGRKFTVFALFYFEFEGNFPSTSPPEGLHLVGRFNGGFLRYRIGGLIHGGAFFSGILRYHLMLSGSFCGPESRHWIFRGLNFGPGIVWGFV